MKNNITLIGMPGCGKSTLGVLLAKSLNLSFTDTDLLLQQKHGALLCQMLESEGIGEFLRREEEIICSLEPAQTGACIATGGSAVYSERAMEHLRSFSTMIFIDLPYAEIKKRVGDIKSRGVVIEGGKTLCDLYSERRPLYISRSDITVEAGGLGVEELLERIIRRLNF